MEFVEIYLGSSYAMCIAVMENLPVLYAIIYLSWQIPEEGGKWTDGVDQPLEFPVEKAHYSPPWSGKRGLGQRCVTDSCYASRCYYFCCL